jgi:hypothetical protein
VSHLHQVTFVFGSTSKTEVIDKLLNNTVNPATEDWIRFSRDNYLIWSAVNAADLYVLFRGTLTQDDHIFIIRTDPRDRFGYLPQAVWQWIDQKARGEKAPLSQILEGLTWEPPKALK